jgi:hypothetical protein
MTSAGRFPQSEFQVSPQFGRLPASELSQEQTLVEGAPGYFAPMDEPASREGWLRGGSGPA